jgi:SAM-dependent methyltransferase
VPGAASLPLVRRQLDKRVTGTGGSNSARYCYSVWLRHLVLAAQRGLNSDPKDVAELGPGDSIGVGLAALLCGAERYRALDVVRHANHEMNLRIFDQLVEMLQRREDLLESEAIHPKLAAYDFPAGILTAQRMARALDPERVARIRRAVVAERTPPDAAVRYCVPWSDAGVLPGASQDLVFSQAVLEHVDALPEAYRAMRGWLKPGGHISHQIDFKSHGWGGTWDGHWRIGRLHWKALRGRDTWFINRQPYSVHLRLLEDAGFRLRHAQPVKAAPTYARQTLAREFSNMPEDDRCTAGAYLLADVAPKGLGAPAESASGKL